MLLNYQRGNETLVENSALAVKVILRKPSEVCGTCTFLASSADSFTHSNLQIVARDNLTRVC